MYHGLLGFAIISTLPKPRMVVVDLILDLSKLDMLANPSLRCSCSNSIAHNIGDAMED